MTYRHALEAAHVRIEQLEDELVEKETTIVRLKRPPAENDASVEREESAAGEEEAAKPAEETAWDPRWRVWPLVVLGVIGVAYVALFGVALPSRDATANLLMSGAAGAALMSIVNILYTLAGDRSSVFQRVLTVVAGLAAVPFLLAVALLAMNAAAWIMMIGGSILAAGGAAYALWSWIRG